MHTSPIESTTQVVWLCINIQIANYNHFKQQDTTTPQTKPFYKLEGIDKELDNLDCKNKTNSREVHTQLDHEYY